MSAIKKQTELRWKRRNEFSLGGRIIATVWSARIGKLSLTITNWTGTSTLEWEISMPETDWRIGAVESRYEHTVSTLKDWVYHEAKRVENNI
jgi:hypothetical protein